MPRCREIVDQIPKSTPSAKRFHEALLCFCDFDTFRFSQKL